MHDRKVELRQLAYFEAVVRCGGFSRAAEHLRIAQPAVSAQVRRLEAELGVALLERTTRRVALTYAGELFLARTRRVLDQVDGARADLDELAAVVRGQLRVGATQVLGAIDLPRSLARFNRRYPGVTLALRSGLVAGLLDALVAGAVDVVLGPIHDDLSAAFRARSLVTDEVVLATPPGRHDLVQPVTLDAVRDEPFICLPEGSGLYGILTAAAASAGFAPRISFETHGPGSIRELVAAGLGVALLAGSAARPAGPPVDVYALDPPPRHPPIGVIHLRGRTPTPATMAWQRMLEDTYLTS